MYHPLIIGFHLCQLLINYYGVIRITIGLLNQLFYANNCLGSSNIFNEFSLLHSDWCRFWRWHFFDRIVIFACVAVVDHVSDAFYIRDVLVFAALFYSSAVVCAVVQVV